MYISISAHRGQKMSDGAAITGGLELLDIGARLWSSTELVCALTC